MRAKIRLSPLENLESKISESPATYNWPCRNPRSVSAGASRSDAMRLPNRSGAPPEAGEVAWNTYDLHPAIQKTPCINSQSVEQWIVRKIKNRSYAILQQNSVAAFVFGGPWGIRTPTQAVMRITKILKSRFSCATVTNSIGARARGISYYDGVFSPIS